MINMLKYALCCSFYFYCSAIAAQPFGNSSHPMNKTTSNTEIFKYWALIEDSDLQIFNAAEAILAENPTGGYAELIRNDEFMDKALKHRGKILAGPMLGSVSESGVSVWIRTTVPAKVEVQVEKEGGLMSFGPVHTNVDTDLVAKVELTGLAPGETYGYQVYVDGELIALHHRLSFKTIPKNTDSKGIKIAFGSCPHRWGLGNEKLWNQIKSRDPIAMLLLGDIAVQDRRGHFGRHRSDYLARDFQPPWSEFTAQIPVYASWDDHDYFDNDKAGVPKGFSEADKIGVREIFKNSWCNPGHGMDDEGIFFRTRIGPADVIMTDNRYFRENKKGSFLGEKQMHWLKEQLLDCEGPFIILSCGSMWSDYVSNGKDSWGVNDPEGREEIFDLIEKNNIEGVLLISGDRHGARGFTIPRVSGYEFYEFEAGSLGARVGPPASKPEWTTQLYGIDGTFAFGEFLFDLRPKDPTVTFNLVSEEGEALYNLILKKSDLSPGRTVK